MSVHITRRDWDRWDETILGVKEALKRINYDIPITCDESACNGDFGRHKMRATICLDTLEIFESASEAGRAVGAISGSQIAKVCRGEAKHYKGHRFAYYDDYTAGTIPRYKGQRRKAKP